MSRRFDPYIQMERQRAAAARRAVAEARAQDASRKRLDRMERMDHLARKLTEAEQETARIADQIKGITDLLGSALPMAWPLEFASLHRAPQFPVFDPQGQDRPLESPRLDSFLPRPLSFMAKLLPGARTRHATAVAQATADFEAKRGERNDLEAGMAKYLASEYCHQVVEDSFRIHGGYGFSKEYEIERLYREAPMLLIGEGTADIQRMIIGRRVLESYAG